MPTNVELEAIIRRLEARVEALEQQHTHELGSRGMLNYVGYPVTIKGGVFRPLKEQGNGDH